MKGRNVFSIAAIVVCAIFVAYFSVEAWQRYHDPDRLMQSLWLLATRNVIVGVGLGVLNVWLLLRNAKGKTKEVE